MPIEKKPNYAKQVMSVDEVVAARSFEITEQRVIATVELSDDYSGESAVEEAFRQIGKHVERLAFEKSDPTAHVRYHFLLMGKLFSLEVDVT